mmetsp:Transcript_28357/g.42951  ORF Transcript_28357/g.42951 Transcript_28357/m.42951 type:complete len:118 (+) Transcript_28357:521-874(+)
MVFESILPQNEKQKKSLSAHEKRARFKKYGTLGANLMKKQLAEGSDLNKNSTTGKESLSTLPKVDDEKPSQICYDLQFHQIMYESIPAVTLSQMLQGTLPDSLVSISEVLLHTFRFI